MHMQSTRSRDTAHTREGLLPVAFFWSCLSQRRSNSFATSSARSGGARSNTSSSWSGRL